MSDERDFLTQTFDRHTRVEPDTAEIMSRVQAIARARRRNRWVVQATGASVITAGLVAGGIALPGLFSGGSTASHVATVRLAGGEHDYSQQQELAAYFKAGYQLEQAQQLAGLWHESNLTRVKAEAGLKLLQGQTLPVAPGSTPAIAVDRDVEAFFNAGYDYNDATKLMAIWHTADAYHAKIKGGKEIESGEALPIKPSGNAGTAAPTTSSSSATAKLRAQKLLGAASAKPKQAPSSGADDGMSPALEAYFNAGYDFSDAQQLATLWHQSDITTVKTEAGKKLLEGQTLPIPPSEQPAPPQDVAVQTFFNDGYTTDDAIRLAKLWHVSTYQAKVKGGEKLERGETLPVQP